MPPTDGGEESHGTGSSESSSQEDNSASVTSTAVPSDADGSTYTTGHTEDATTSVTDTTTTESTALTEDAGADDMGSEAGCWQQHPLPHGDRALDFDVGVDGDLWVISDAVAPYPYPDFRILWRANQISAPWFDIAGGAVKAAAGPAKTGWVAASTRLSFRWVEPSWELLEGAIFDLSVGAGGQAWAVGTTPCEGGYCVHEFTETLPKPGWVATALPERGGISIAVDHVGLPWVVDKQGRLWRWRETGWQEVGPEQGFVVGVGIGGVLRERAWILLSPSEEEREFGELWSWTTPDVVHPESSWRHLGEAEAEGSVVSVDSAGEPWLLRRDGSIWQRVAEPSGLGECALPD